MALELTYLRDHIVIPTLLALEMNTPNATEQVLGTCAAETDFGTFRRQLGEGPGRGIYSLEEATFLDNWRYLRLHFDILAKVLALCPDVSENSFSLIEDNDVFATIMCRIKYWMVQKPIPGNLEDMAEYWKKYYNTPSGRGAVEDFVEKYNLYVAQTD